jgi:hypothetical protein
MMEEAAAAINKRTSLSLQPLHEKFIHMRVCERTQEIPFISSSPWQRTSSSIGSNEQEEGRAKSIFLLLSLSYFSSSSGSGKKKLSSHLRRR